MFEVGPTTPALAEQVFTTWENLRWVRRESSYFIGVRDKGSFGYEAEVGGGFFLHFFCDHSCRFLDGDGLIPVPVTSYVVRLLWDGEILQGISYSEFKDMPFVPSLRLFEGARQLKKIFHKINEKTEPPRAN